MQLLYQTSEKLLSWRKKNC